MMTDPTDCDRCGADLSQTGSTMSTFNTETICVACKRDEKDAPGYRNADCAERDAVMGGFRNFPGVGLSVEDRTFLERRRNERAK
jgi:hypothetical protein